MKGKLTVILCIICVLAVGLMGKSYIDGANTNKVSTVNPMSEYKTIAELQNSVPFTFQVPNVVAEADNLALFNYMNLMVEIQADDMVFRAAEDIEAKADVSGIYEEFPIDNTYRDGNETISVRYRTDNKITLVNITTRGSANADLVSENTVYKKLSYSIKFNYYMSEIEAFEKLDLDITKLKYVEVEETQKEETNTEVETENNNTVENDSSNDELTFKLYKVENTSISFMLPNIANEVKTVYADNQLAVMLGGKLVFVIESIEADTNTEYNGYVVTKLENNYILRYAVNNPFEKDTQIYRDYYTIIENMQTVVDTFNVN